MLEKRCCSGYSDRDISSCSSGSESGNKMLVLVVVVTIRLQCRYIW